MHHLAGHAYYQQGLVVDAFRHSQEALKITGALYAALWSPGVAGQEADSAHHDHDNVGASNSGRSGADASGVPVGEDGCAGANEASSSSSSSSLSWLVLSQYLTSLLQAAEVFEACGCAEDASCLLQETSRLAACVQAHGLCAVAVLWQAHLARKQGDVDVATGYVDQAAQHVQGTC